MCHTLAVVLIHTSLSNVDFGVMTLVLVLAQVSRNPWLGELSETALLRWQQCMSLGLSRKSGMGVEG